MKKVLVILLMLSLVAGVWAQKKMELVLLNNGLSAFSAGFDTGGYNSPQEKAVGEYMKANPNVNVTIMVRDITKGSLTADALMAKGTPPDVWWDAAGYFPKYLVPEYALPLEKYINLKNYQKDLVDMFSRGGHAYALPVLNVVASMGINLDMLKEIGYTMPAQKDWTIDEFLKVAEKLKAKGYPATIIMTKDGMIDWNMGWIYAFGGKLYANGDHSKVAINTPESVKALEFMKMMADKGYAYPNPNEQNDDAGVELFTTYKVFSCMLQNGHVDGWVPEQVKQGKLEKPFEYDFVEFPHVKGQAHTPVQGYQTVVVGHNSGNEEKNKAIAKLMEAVGNNQFQQYIVAGGGGFPAWVGAELPAGTRQSTKNLAKLASTAGLMDVGVYLPKRPEVRRAWLVPIQEFFAGKIGAKEVLQRFEADANKVLAQ